MASRPFLDTKVTGSSSRSRPWDLLTGAAIPRGQVQDYGFLFLVVDPGAMLPGNPFAAQMSQLVKAIQATPHKPGAEDRSVSHRGAPPANASAGALKASSSTGR
jgi:hypothetical protein